MSDTARDYQTVESSSIEGLEDLFNNSTATLISKQSDSDPTTIIEQADPDQSLLTTPISPDHWTLSVAAQNLQLSVITIRRRLQRNELKGYKVQGINGPEWRVIPPDHQTLISEQGDSDPTPIIEQGNPDQTILTTPISSDQAVINVLLKRLADVEGQLTSAQKELQGAVWRNGYLESQLENGREQIKLLTDSQHKGSWWAGFKKWFFGR